ncbi:MAG: sensor histidine kinase [Armatimonadota bacterium]
MTDHRSEERRAEVEGSRSRRSLLYAIAILLVLMLIMSGTTHLLTVRPAALVGFPVMIIAATSLLLLLLYLVGPRGRSDEDDPVRVVTSAMVPALGIDPQTGRILAANDEAAEFFGCDRTAPGGHLADVLDGGPSEEAGSIVRETLDRGEVEAQACSVRRASGKPAVVRLTARLVERERSPFIVIGIAENEVSDVVAEFARIQERLMSNISHELRTPLNVVMGFSELLVTGTLGEMPPNQLDAAEECHEGGERMLRLINDILDVGRSRSYYLDGETRSLSPLEMIRRVESLLVGQARREELRLELDLDESLPVLEIEERAFKQLVYHLIVNSMSRSAAGDTIRIAARRDDGQMVLSVSDSGEAVTEDVRPQPMPSVAEHDAAETLAPPLLGLRLCATLAERLGGNFSTESDEDGTRLIVRLPLLRS